MATAPPTIAQWYRWLSDDLQPMPGRLASSVRVVVSVVLAMILLLVLQVPFASLALYLIFVLGRESPAVSLRSGLLSTAVGCTAVIVELGVVILTDNDPVARLLSVAVMTFIAGVLTQASAFAPLAPTLGLLYCTVIALWETQTPADTIVKNSLFLIAAEALALGCAVFTEYLFADRSAVERLEEELAVRYKALESMFRAYAKGATKDELFSAYLPVARLAMAGQRGMQELYNVIIQRNLDPRDLPLGTRVRITLLAQLVDAAAAFGAASGSDDPQLCENCAWIADRCREMASCSVPLPDQKAKSAFAPLLSVNECLHALMAMPVNSGQADDKKLIVLPSKKVPFFVPGTLQARSTFTFGLKISLCATICYILYHALDYPGISTAVTTVLVSGLASTGAMKQKLAHRLVGAIVGGLLLGLGSIVFLFPHMDSITALCGLVAVVAFIAAWCAAGRRFNYIGLQIAFSFFTVTLATSSAPSELAPARDRLVGIGLALVTMWFVFDQLWPVRTVTMMRRALASVLRAEAKLLTLRKTGLESGDLQSRVNALRNEVGKTIVEIRTLNEAVIYEFGVGHEEHKAAGATILRAALSSGALFWNELVALEREQERDLVRRPELSTTRSTLADRLNAIADSVVNNRPIEPVTGPSVPELEALRGAREAEYASTMMSRYRDIESILATLGPTA